VPTHRSALLAAVAALAVSATITTTASAGTLVKSAASCAAESLSQPFLPWADIAQYTLVPGGAAESKTGWKLGRGAGIVSGSEPWSVHSANDRRHLALKPGSSATTHAVCVGIDHPTLRFFARSSSATPNNWLLVEVLFETASGRVMSAPIGGIPATGAWAPTAPIAIVANLLPLMPGNTTAVALRLTPTAAAAWDVDDVYVDPFGRT
jgi:hypothetical protein